MDIECEVKRLKQEDSLRALLRKPQMSDMLTVYFSSDDNEFRRSIYCALIPIGMKKKCLDTFSWDLSMGNGFPGVIEYYDQGKSTPIYYRHGTDSGIEPLIYYRSFGDIRPSYQEICEEFRHFHQLYYDEKENQYLKIDDSGSEHVVAIIEPDQISIRLKELRQFLAIKEMYLSLQFDFREFSQAHLEELELSTKDNRIEKSDSQRWNINYGTGDGMCSFNSFSRLCGKTLIEPLSKDKSEMWGFAKEREVQCVDFIIDADDNGEEILHTCNPNLLADGATIDAPHYLTPVHFHKSVLDKYHNRASKYFVTDSYLVCGSLWGLQMDNHHSERVCVWLGDLGRDLPYNEQLHWRSHNILPSGSVSETYFKRQILSTFADSEQPDHIFKSRYQSFLKLSRKQMSWDLLLPLSEGDVHHLAAIRIPVTEEQGDFDNLIMGLTKLLVDSINEKKLNTFMSKEEKSNISGSINRLEKVFEILSVDDYSIHVSFLRKLQNLRSAGAAHRKGKTYHKISAEFGVGSSSLKLVFEKILENANELLLFFERLVLEKRLQKNGAVE